MQHYKLFYSISHFFSFSSIAAFELQKMEGKTKEEKKMKNELVLGKKISKELHVYILCISSS